MEYYEEIQSIKESIKRRTEECNSLKLRINDKNRLNLYDNEIIFDLKIKQLKSKGIKVSRIINLTKTKNSGYLINDKSVRIDFLNRIYNNYQFVPCRVSDPSKNIFIDGIVSENIIFEVYKLDEFTNLDFKYSI